MAFSKISIASSFNIVSGILRTKIYAVILGVYGIGISSQILNLNSLIVFLGSIGLPLGLTKFISEWEKDGRFQDIKNILNTSISILLIVSFFVILLSLFLSASISKLILGNEDYYYLIIITFLAYPFITISSILDALLRGLKEFNKYVVLSLLLSLFSIITTILFVYYYKLTGVTLSLLVSSIFGLFLYLIFISKSKIFAVKELFKFELKFGDSFKMIMGLGLASLVLGLTDQFVLLSMRSIIINELGILQNGIYQTVYAISNNYLNVFFMTLGIYLLPVLSEIKNLDDINSEINSIFRLTLLIIVPIIAITFTFREIIIIMLYSSEFLSSSHLFIYNLFGDFFRAVSWVLGAWLIPQSRIRTWLFLGIIYNVNLFILFCIMLFILKIDLYSIVVSYMVANSIHFILNFSIIMKYNKFRLTILNLKSFVFSLIFLMLLLFSSNVNILYGYILLAPLLTIWVLISVKRKEFVKLKNLIFDKIIYNAK